MAKDYSEIDAKIFAAIRGLTLAASDFPTLERIAEVVGVTGSTVWLRLKDNFVLVAAREEKAKEIALGLPESDFILETSGLRSLQMRAQDSSVVQNAIFARIDEIILRRLISYSGFPTSVELSDDAFYRSQLIQKRINTNPTLKRTQEEKALAYSDKLTDAEFIQQTAKAGGLQTRAIGLESVKNNIYARMDRLILAKMQTSKYAPTANALSQIEEFYSSKIIQSRIDANLALKEAQDRQGVRYVTDLSENDFIAQTAKSNGLQAEVKFLEKTARVIGQRIDQIILRKIQECEGIPSASSLSRVLSYSIATIQSRIDENQELVRAQGLKSLAYVDGLAEIDFIKQTSGDSVLLQRDAYHLPTVKQAIDARIAKIVFDHIILFEGGIPYTNALAHIPGFYSHPKLQAIIEDNPILKDAQEAKAIQYLEGLSEQEFISQTARAGGLQSELQLFPRVQLRLYERIDAIILRTINQFEGIPSGNALSEIDGFYGTGLIQSRINANPSIRIAQEKRGIEYVEGLSEEECILQTAKLAGLQSVVQNLPNLRAKLYERIDAIILRTINQFEGIPSGNALSEIDGFYGTGLIQSRINANPSIRIAQEKRGIEYVEGLSEEEFILQTTKNACIQVNAQDIPNILTKIYERMDLIILRKIQEFEGIPSIERLSNAIRIGSHILHARIDSNLALKQAQLSKAIKYLETLSDDEFIESTAKTGGTQNDVRFLPELKPAIIARIDAIILRKIQEFEGIPSTNALSRITGFYTATTLQRHIDSNLTLKQAQEDRGIAYAQGLSEEDFIQETAKKAGLLASVRILSRTQNAILIRIDQIILRKIQEFEGSPTFNALSIEGFYGNNFIQGRIEANPILFQAYYEKKGLTLDQAVELQLDKGEGRSDAVTDILSKRLKQLFAFREVLGLVKYFSDVFDHAKQVLEVSLYPQPLKQALEMEGKIVQAGSAQYVDLKEARADPIKAAKQADVVLLQGIHRMTVAQFNDVLFEIHKTLPPGAVVFATYSNDYRLAESAPDALAQKGFTLDIECSGQLKIHAPETEVLTDLGVDQDDLSRVRAKLSGSSNVLCLLRSEVLNQEVIIPALESVDSSSTGAARPAVIIPGATVPEGAIPHIDASLTTSLRIASSCEPFILTVMDGEQRVAEIGYGANPGTRNRLEVETCKGYGRLQKELRRQAQELLRDSSKRASFVNPNSIVKVQRTRLIA